MGDTGSKGEEERGYIFGTLSTKFFFMSMMQVRIFVWSEVEKDHVLASSFLISPVEMPGNY